MLGPHSRASGTVGLWLRDLASRPLLVTTIDPTKHWAKGREKRVPGTYAVLSQITPLSSKYLFVASLKYTS